MFARVSLQTTSRNKIEKLEKKSLGDSTNLLQKQILAELFQSIGRATPKKPEMTELKPLEKPCQYIHVPDKSIDNNKIVFVLR